MTHHELLTRGVEKVIPLELAQEKLKSGKKLRVYLGIDPTGSELHLGHTLPLRKLQAFAEAGHHAILVIGSFTAMIGDPSGRDTLREPLTREQIEANFKTYKKQAAKVLDFKSVELRYNHEWLEKLRFEEILKLASHFTMQQMRERDMFRRRDEAGQPVGIHEFMYPLMVGYDSVVLDVDCELGGTDQEFNMLAGRTLQKAYGKREKFILTTPLLEGLDGRKMSKTYGNTVNLMDEPADMFGKIMSLKDELIIRYFLLCTNLPLKEVDEIDKALKSGTNPRDPKIRLASEIVTLYHSANSAAGAREEFGRVFREGGVPTDMPEFKLKGPLNIVDLILACKLAASKSEARRLVEQGGVRVDDRKVTDPDAVIHIKKHAPSEAEGGMILKVGKRGFGRII